MINLLPIEKVIAGIVVIFCVIFLIILRFEPEKSLLDEIFIASKLVLVVNVVLLFTFNFGWRILWKKFPSLNRLLFPDLNGEWNMIIHWEWGDKKGVANATAHIKQDFLKISMEMESNESESESLLAKPKKDSESGRPFLYYIYRNTPKNINGNTSTPYEGAAILKLDHTDLNSLKGNYFTNRQSFGYYELTRRNS